jgi:hypothetical protein
VTKNCPYQVNVGGYAAKGCELSVVPYQGGEYPQANYSKVGLPPAGGKWGPITLNGLPKGQYLILGAVTMVKCGAATQSVYSSSTVLTVP